ncbi:MAG: recombinase family protein [Candidatus Izemoplasmatales bacterium]
MQNGNTAAIYCRLSRDEDTNQESNSIQSQRLMLTDFAARQGFHIEDEYVDDGFSGTNYDRPDFKRMIEDAEKGRFGVIITKDLSRLGRDYLTTGEYMEKIFPRLNIRYIAMNDGYDSMAANDGNADFAPIRNYFNEWYAKDCSRKTRASFAAMAKAGKFIGSKAPFGYVKDREDKHHLLLDEEAAAVVRKIFDYAATGHGYKAISKRLRDEGILNPNAYNNIADPTFHQSGYWRQPHDWHPSSIKTILSNPTYLGHVVNGRRKVKSFKCKEIVSNQPEDWIVVEDRHDAIITKRVWDMAQENLKKRKRSGHNGAIQIFAGLLKCADCGYSMAYSRNNGADHNGSYRCSLNNVKGKNYCSSHYITYDALYQIVLKDIQRKAFVARLFQDNFMRTLTAQTAGTLQEKLKKAEKEIKRLSARAVDLEQIIAKLYEDHALGRITAERYDTFMLKYEAEKKQVEAGLQDASAVLEEEKAQFDNAQHFTEVILSYADLKELTAPILNELIDRIEIGKKEVVDGEKTQSIRILYKQVGYVEMFSPSELFGDDLNVG